MLRLMVRSRGKLGRLSINPKHMGGDAFQMVNRIEFKYA